MCDVASLRSRDVVEYVGEGGHRQSGVVVATSPYAVIRQADACVYLVLRRGGRTKVVDRVDEGAFRGAPRELLARITDWMRLHEPEEVPIYDGGGDDNATGTASAV